MSLRHLPGQSPAFARRFERELSGLARSDGYQLLDNEGRQVPGLVFSAVATYLESTDDGQLITGAGIIEDAAATDDTELHNYLVTEIFESWRDLDADARERLLRTLGPQSRKLYDRWLG